MPSSQNTTLHTLSLPAACLAALTDTLGADAVRTGSAIPTERQTDWSGTAPLAPLAWLRPASTAQVSAALRYPLWLQSASVPVSGALIVLHSLTQLMQPTSAPAQGVTP